MACLTRETGIYVPLAAVLIQPSSRWSWIALGLGGLLILGLRFALGTAPPEITLAALRARNLEPANLRAALLGFVLVAGACLALAVTGYGRTRADFRRVAWLVPLHAALVAVFGVWVEARLWLITLPVLLPLAWAAVFLPVTTPRSIRDTAAKG